MSLKVFVSLRLFILETIDTRGRSDWSLQNLITFEMDGPFQPDLYTINNVFTLLQIVGKE
jgi:hypothetical protein